jgi:opacity protein-like surface antigen
MIQQRVVRAVVPALAALFVAAAPALAEWVVVPPRAGQVGLGAQGQFGGLLNSGGIGEEFDAGPGLAVRLRYRMRYERGLGLSFESQRFDVREPSLADTAAKYITLYHYGIDIYQMFGTRTRTTRWVSAGFGLAQPRRTLNSKEVEFGTDRDGVYVAAGAGFERFFWQSWAIDASTRYSAVFIDGRTNHDFQVSLGLIVYASY